MDMPYEFERTHRIAVLGGGPGGYEAALAGAQLGAEVTLVEREGVGGSAVLTDVGDWTPHRWTGVKRKLGGVA